MGAATKFYEVALPIIKAEHLNPHKSLQRPREAGGGILSTGEQHQRGFGLELIAHQVALALIDPQANRRKQQRARSFHWDRPASCGIQGRRCFG